MSTNLTTIGNGAFNMAEGIPNRQELKKKGDARPIVLAYCMTKILLDAPKKNPHPSCPLPAAIHVSGRHVRP